MDEIANRDEKINIPVDEILLSTIQNAKEIKDEKKTDVVRFVEIELKIRSGDFKTIWNKEEKKSKRKVHLHLTME